MFCYPIIINDSTKEKEHTSYGYSCRTLLDAHMLYKLVFWLSGVYHGSGYLASTMAAGPSKQLEKLNDPKQA